MQRVLPAILDGLSDESEGVRDAALAAGRIFVDHYANTALTLLLPAVSALSLQGSLCFCLLPYPVPGLSSASLLKPWSASVGPPSLTTMPVSKPRAKKEKA